MNIDNIMMGLFLTGRIVAVLTIGFFLFRFLVGYFMNKYATGEVLTTYNNVKGKVTSGFFVVVLAWSIGYALSFSNWNAPSNPDTITQSYSTDIKQEEINTPEQIVETNINSVQEDHDTAKQRAVEANDAAMEQADKLFQPKNPKE